MEMTVGMSAPPIGMISSTPNGQGKQNNQMKRQTRPNAHRVQHNKQTQQYRKSQQAEVNRILIRIRDRPLRNERYPLQLAGGHQAAGEREKAQENFRHERKHDEFRNRVPFASHHVKLRHPD